MEKKVWNFSSLEYPERNVSQEKMQKESLMWMLVNEFCLKLRLPQEDMYVPSLITKNVFY